jgi:hypothetical protein
VEEEEGCHQAMMEEEEDHPWGALAEEVAGFRHLAWAEAEEEEHQQAFRSAEAGERRSHRWPEQA